MKIKNKLNATSIVEAIVILLIIVSWITWMYNIYTKSIKLSNWITNKIQAIQIAKQWIEAMTNIRDTNWLLFSSDYDNCWNVLNYQSWCIWDNWSDWDATTFDIKNWSRYIIYLDLDNRWILDKKNSSTFWVSTYNQDFKVWLNNWIYTQSWATEETNVLFTREINISYLQIDWTTPWDETDPKMLIKSIVQWTDNSSTSVRRVEMEQLLSNWKK